MSKWNKRYPTLLANNTDKNILAGFYKDKPMIKIVSKKNLMQFYKRNIPDNVFEKRRAEFYLNMFDNPLVDALYIYFMDKDEYIGECVLVFRDEREIYEFEYEKDILGNNDSCLIKNLWIRNNMRGKGYFTKFLNEIKTLAYKKGCRCLVFSVAKNNTHAIDIYSHLKAYRFCEEREYSDVGQMLFMKIDL